MSAVTIVSCVSYVVLPVGLLVTYLWTTVVKSDEGRETEGEERIVRHRHTYTVLPCSYTCGRRRAVYTVCRSKRGFATFRRLKRAFARPEYI